MIQTKFKGYLFFALLLCVVCGPAMVWAQPTTAVALDKLFHDAGIRMDPRDQSPLEIRFSTEKPISVADFFTAYKTAFGLSAENEFRVFQTTTDKLRQTHYRIKQYYKGVELAEVQYLLHEKNGGLHYANGRLIHGLNLDVQPSLSEAAALQHALDHIRAERYMWENPKNEGFLKKERNDPNATYYPQGVRMLSAGRNPQRAENFRLVYRFDIFSERPSERYFVDVDAHSGEVIHQISQFPSGDVAGEGQSLYDGLVPLTVSDQDYPEPVSGIYWHLSPWNAFGLSGESWWMADPELGNQGGYDNEWYQVLDTDSILLSGGSPVLSFQHRYAVEPPAGAAAPYNGWDGMNVRVSTDGGETWTVLPNPSPGYSNSSLYSFGEQHGEGPGIPGWTGRLDAWTPVSIDLSAYAGQTVRIRFAFASDPAYSTADPPQGDATLFGWQIDEILVANEADTLFHNNGIASGMTPKNQTKLLTPIAGNYRLRESGRGAGIFTINARNGTSFPLSTDFVDEDSSFTDTLNFGGVSAHFAAEGTYDYYLNVHGRDSYDGEGSPVLTYVHWDQNWTNAQWLGDRMRFGDGDGNFYGPLVSIDVVGHEFTHGVTQFSAGLIYQDESGALNESFSDIFGEMVEYYLRGEVDWLVGDDFALAAASFRSMSNPNARSDPDTYFGNFWAPLGGPDAGGVHTNSGVQNYWFYLLAEGGSGTNDNGDSYSFAGIGIEKAAQIAYRNLTVYLMPTSDYGSARVGSINAAIDLYGEGSPEYQAVLNAWFAVGVNHPVLAPALSANLSSLDFLAEVGAADTASVTITSLGLDTLVISDLQLTGSDFQLVNPPSLPLTIDHYLDTYEIRVAFVPSASGAVQDTLTISSNDPQSPQTAIALNGSGFTIAPAAEGVIYGVTGSAANGVVITIDQHSGSGSEVGLSGQGLLRDVGVDPASGVLFAITDGSSATRLLRVDAQTGNAIEKTEIPVANIRQMAVDSNGDIYGGVFATGLLYRIEANTGQATQIGPTNVRPMTGLAINPLDGQLWGTNLSNDLFIIDKTTGQATRVGNTGISGTTGIEFDADGKLYGIAGLGTDVGELMQIDTGSGAGTIIGSTGFASVTGLAIRGSVLVGIDEIGHGAIPSQFRLYANFPNPFNPSTTIRYDLPAATRVILKIYNVVGQEVRTLVSENQAPGKYQVTWDGRDHSGAAVASGIYLFRIDAGTFGRTRKMLFVK